MISRYKAFAKGIRLAWRYCPISALAAVCLLLFPASILPIAAICLIAFIAYSAFCGAEGRVLR